MEQPKIWAGNGMDAQLVHSALEDYLAKLEEDKRTRYNNDPRFCQEDVDFLFDATTRTRLLMHDLKRQHRDIVVKG